MDRLGADYVIKTYPDALHGFTNPATTALGQKYGIPSVTTSQLTVNLGRN